MKKYLESLGKVLNRNLALCSVAVSLFALAFPAPFVSMTHIALNLSSVSLFAAHFPKLSFVNILLGVIMFGMGMTLGPEDFWLILKRPGDVLTGVLSQYVYMAGFGFLVAKIFSLSGIGSAEQAAGIAVGLVLLGCVPGGTASNVMTFLARGDVALSVTITMCTTILAPVLTPSLTLVLAGQWIAVDFLNMFLSIVLVVLLPILLGIMVHAVLGSRVNSVRKYLVLLSTVCILLVLGMCVGPNRGSFLNNGFMLVLMTSLAVLLHHILGLLAGYYTAKMLHMPEQKIRTMSLEIGLQNSGLSVTLANTAFPGTMAVLPCVLATVIHQVVGPVVAGFFASRDFREEREAVRLSLQRV